MWRMLAAAHQLCAAAAPKTRRLLLSQAAKSRTCGDDDLTLPGDQPFACPTGTVANTGAGAASPPTVPTCCLVSDTCTAQRRGQQVLCGSPSMNYSIWIRMFERGKLYNLISHV